MKTFFERWSFKAGSGTEHFACALLTALDGPGVAQRETALQDWFGGLVMVRRLLERVFVRVFVSRRRFLGAQNGNQNNNEDNDEAAGKGRVHKDALIEGPDLA